MQLDEVLQVFSCPAAVVVQPAHVLGCEPGDVELWELQRQLPGDPAAGGVDVGNQHDATGILLELLQVFFAQAGGLAAEPHGLVAHAQTVGRITATADDHHLREFLLAALLELPAQGVESEDVILGQPTDDEEPVGLVEVLRLVDLLELSGDALFVDIVAGLHEDGVVLGGFLDGGYLILGGHYRCDGGPAEFFQVLGFDARAPCGELVVGEGLFGGDPRRLTDLALCGVALGDLGLVDFLVEFLAHAVLLHQFVKGQRKLLLRIASVAHVDVDR